MYSDVKSRVSFNNQTSNIFASEIGVRQGENLSPLLFSLYLNDLQNYLENLNINDLKSITTDAEEELHIFFKLFLLLYADDTVLLAESSSDLQILLNTFSDYCNQWKLKINIDKTKIMVFSKGKVSNNLKFFINGRELEIVKQYKYLGVIFSSSGSFLATRKYIKEQGMKALYAIIKKCRFNHLSIRCQLDMFDKAIEPILLYGSEIWGFENIEILEKVQLYFCKHILRLKQSTPNFMIYGELGQYPLSIKIKLRMVDLWIRLNRNENKISSILCKLLSIYYTNYGFENKWICYVKSIFDNCGMSNIWLNTDLYSKEWIIESLKQKLKDQYLQEWLGEINTSPKGLCYRIFNTEFKFEN